MLQHRHQLWRSSAQKLPPIVKFPSKQLSKHRINRLDVSLEVIRQMPQPKMLVKAGNSKNNKSNMSNHKGSLRLRTDSVSANISLDKNSSRQKDLKSEPYDSQKTLQDFHKNIRINKQYIHRQIKKRNQKTKRSSKQNSKGVLQQNQQKKKKQIKQKRRATEDTVIFDEIQDIISRKFPFSSRNPHQQKQKSNFNKIKNAVKMIKINKNLRYLNPESPAQMRDSLQQQSSNSSSRLALKNQNNYHEWRRVELNSDQKSLRYKLTNFEIQNQRLKQYVLKNQVSLSNYFQFKNQLYLTSKLRTSS